MPFQPCPFICEVVIAFSNTAGSQANNVLHFRWNTTEPITQEDVDALVGDVDSAVSGFWLPLMHPDGTYLETRAKMLTSIVDLVGSTSAGTGPGESAETPLPSNVSFVVTLRSGLSGRSARGRVYLPYIVAPSGSVLDQVTVGYANSCVSYINAIKNSAADDGWKLCVLSRRTAGAERLIGVGFDITSVVARNIDVDSQRGRLISGH